MLNIVQFYQISIWVMAVFTLLFVSVRVIRWYRFYYDMRKNKCIAYDFMPNIKRQLYVKPIQWLRQRNRFFHIEYPIEITDYSEGYDYFINKSCGGNNYV